MSINEEGISKGMRTRAEKQAEELLSQVEAANGMKYEKSRKKKAEALRSQLSKVDIICGAIERATGKICTNKPHENAKRCLRHGGASTGAVTPEGKQRALANLNPKANFISGMYGRFVMSAEESTFYETMLNYYIEEADLDPANILLLDRALRNFILNQRKEWADEGEAINGVQFDIDYDTKFMRYMQALGLDRKFNVSKEHKDNAGSGGIAMLFLDEE